MNTNMTGFDGFKKSLRYCALALEGQRSCSGNIEEYPNIISRAMDLDTCTILFLPINVSYL